MTAYAERGFRGPECGRHCGRTLLFGGIGTVLGVFRMASVGALAVFLLVVTPIVHDFWRGPEAFSGNGR